MSIGRELISELGWNVGDRLYLAKHGQFPRFSQVWREKVPGDNQGVPLTLRHRQGTFYIALPRAFVDYFRLETGQGMAFEVMSMGYEQGKRLMFSVNPWDGVRETRLNVEE